MAAKDKKVKKPALLDGYYIIVTDADGQYIYGPVEVTTSVLKPGLKLLKALSKDEGFVNSGDTAELRYLTSEHSEEFDPTAVMSPDDLPTLYTEGDDED